VTPNVGASLDLGRWLQGSEDRVLYAHFSPCGVFSLAQGTYKDRGGAPRMSTWIVLGSYRSPQQPFFPIQSSSTSRSGGGSLNQWTRTCLPPTTDYTEPGGGLASDKRPPTT